MLPFQLNLDTNQKVVNIELPSLQLNDEVLDYIRDYDYTQIPIQDFNQTQTISSNKHSSNSHLDNIIASLFSVDLRDLQSDEPEMPKKHRISLSETSFSMLSPESSVKKSKPKYKKQKLLDVYIPNSSSVLGSPPKSINWKNLELSEINTICQEMIHSHADTNALLDGMLRIIGNINLSWFYELDKKLPLYVYEQLLPRDDKILQILLKYYPDQVEDCIYYILDNTTDYQRLFVMLNICFMIPSTNLQDASVIVIKHLLQDISLNKSVIIGLLKELSLKINNQNFPIAHYLFKQLLNGLYIFYTSCTNIKLKPIWLDILIDGLVNCKPFVGPTAINISLFPTDVRNVWSSLLSISSDPSISNIDNLPNFIFSLILPSFKCYLQPLLSLKEQSNIQLRCKSTKLLFILYNLLPNPLQSKLSNVFVNLTRDKSPLVRDTALDICFHLPLSDQLQSIVIERIYDVSIKVRKSAIKFINHLFLNKPHYIHCSLLFLQINDPDIQPIILKSLQSMILHQFPLSKSYFQLTPNDTQIVLVKSKLLVNALLWLSKHKSVDPTLYLRTFYNLLSKSNLKLVNHYFQMTVDCYMDTTTNTTDMLLFNQIITQINPKWCFEYVSSCLAALNGTTNEQQLALQILHNIAKVDPTIVHSSQLLSQLLSLLQHANVQLIELSMPLLNQLMLHMSAIDTHRVKEHLQTVYSELSMQFTNRHALIIGLTMRYSSLYALLDVQPQTVLTMMRQFNSPIKFKCICDLVMGHGHLIMVIVNDYTDTSANAQLLLQALLHVIQMEPINKLELVGEDVIDTLIVDALTLYLPLVDKMLVHCHIAPIRSLLSQLVAVVAIHALVHPKMVCTLFYGLLMVDYQWFMKQDGYLTMMQKYPEIVVSYCRHVTLTSHAFVNPMLVGLNKKQQKVMVCALLDKIGEMDEMAWIRMVVEMEWEPVKMKTFLREMEIGVMVEDEYKGNCIGVALMGLEDKGILGKLVNGDTKEIVREIVDGHSKKRKRSD